MESNRNRFHVQFKGEFIGMFYNILQYFAIFLNSFAISFAIFLNSFGTKEQINC